MKKNLRSACLLFIVFLFFTLGFAGLGSAEDAYNYSFNEDNYTGKWDNLSSPASEYNIWGFPGKTYNFTTKYNSSLFLNSTYMVFYWDCKNNTSDYTPVRMSNYTHHRSIGNGENLSNCTHIWNETRTYYISVGVFQDGKPINVSYWIPIDIKNDTDIEVKTFYMLDENEEFGRSKSYDNSIRANSSKNSDNSSNSSASSKYCGYAKNHYSFNVTLNATSLLGADDRAINETIIIVNWDDCTSDSSLNINNNYNNTGSNVTISAGNFTHEWDGIGEKKINATSFHWDPLDGNRMYSKYSNESNKSILIIRDPKNFISYPIIGNLQNWGIFLSILGLIIFYFTYTRNNVPIEISIFGLKPFYLKSVNSFTGTLIFVAGMYLWFVFGRCPWDIPIVSGLDWLSNKYFDVLYYEYVTNSHSGIPYLSIMLGIIYVFVLSLIIHLIAIPFYKGEFKIGEFLRRKITSTSAQPEMISYAVENKTNREN